MPIYPQGAVLHIIEEDMRLEQRALEACGYRVHVKERNGTRWLMAVKGLGVRYEHWHPLTNIHQAMQLLIDCPRRLETIVGYRSVCAVFDQADFKPELVVNSDNAHDLINAQCRAIVTACASLKPVR